MRLYGASPAAAPGFNYLMVTEGRPLPAGFADYAQAACFPKGVCLYKRPGSCRAAGPELTAEPNPMVAATLRKLGANQP